MANISIIEELPNIIREGKIEAQNIMNHIGNEDRYVSELIIPCRNIDGLFNGTIGEYKKAKWRNRLIYGDNLDIMESLLVGNDKELSMKGKIDLIYIDPPFLTKSDYKSKISILKNDEIVEIEQLAYSDTWKKGIVSYLKMLYPRLVIMRELLSEKGSIYVHLDWHVLHYVKIIMDEIFGEENFLNEIIWSYKSGGVSKKYFSRKHDTILLYSKTRNYIFNPQKEKSYNRNFKPYRFKGVKEFQDEMGWYTLVNMKDVWEIDMVGRTSGERVGYATQKPENLLKRIILSSSNEDSIVADFFAGSGTTGIAAERLNRRWIMTDIGRPASIAIQKRLIGNEVEPFIFKKLDEKSTNTKSSSLILKSIDKVPFGEGKELICIELKDYILDIESININKKYKNLIYEIAEKDSLSLIEYISIDPMYNGETFISRWQDYRHKENGYKINSRIELKIPKTEEKHQIFIKIVDIFGAETSVLKEI